MAPLKIGINGFGRIGRLVMRAAQNNPAVQVVARVNSGENAGHTVIGENGVKYDFHLCPSGLLTPGKVNVVGPECVMDPVSFMQREVKQLIDTGVSYKDRLFIGNVFLVCPHHKVLDLIRSWHAPNTSTLQGMAPVLACLTPPAPAAPPAEAAAAAAVDAGEWAAELVEPRAALFEKLVELVGAVAAHAEGRGALRKLRSGLAQVQAEAKAAEASLSTADRKRAAALRKKSGEAPAPVPTAAAASPPRQPSTTSRPRRRSSYSCSCGASSRR